ncbi:DEAD/DEAH box helicase [Senegalia massiliensis]|uniref:RNA helicase n=1 Tax=Senegalia massiliensis TaxID=1720316 RepID=A0A845QTJ6_9CLOT|nr:DEAD/DEAH box helicase [Senegalia massiliensis]NBI05865.1 DEAD/DEAH box helicase [Senegalia massiliensis]
MDNKFLKLGINTELVKVLERNRIIKPTPVQSRTIPQILNGKDVVVQAQTGTGKTLAFMLPIMQNIDTTKPEIKALIVAPTRELALQITREAKKLSEVNEAKILAAYGGKDVNSQIKKLKGNIDIVIGTPGRLLDHLRRGTINLGKLKYLVLDEADQMLHMGFLHDIEDIISKTPKDRNTMLFSATIPNGIRSLSKRYSKNPVQIEIESKNITIDKIEQIVVETTDRGKLDSLLESIEKYNPFLAIIFCRTKRRAKSLNENLQSKGYNSDEIHGDLSQAKRERVMKNFRNAKLQFLVATDVAARGIDINNITHVFNYDIPQDPESYIHRIGRTARAGEEGIAVTFVSPKDRIALNNIEKTIKTTIEKKKNDKENKKQKRSYKKEKNKNYKKNKSKGKYRKNKKSNKRR